MHQAIKRIVEKVLSKSLAEHQIQLYNAVMRALEMQSGISITPLRSPATPAHQQQQLVQMHGPIVENAVYGSDPHPV